MRSMEIKVGYYRLGNEEKKNSVKGGEINRNQSQVSEASTKPQGWREVG